MSTEFKPVQTETQGTVHMTQFAGKGGRCMQLTARTREGSNSNEPFQAMSFSKADARAMAFALLEWSCDEREECPVS
tara:strand:- start:283 stop:513 length:231 start_codon:yes stop_codon:yes gene_type:complete